jgi:N-acetylglucosamine-6-phosphate deacetylase
MQVYTADKIFTGTGWLYNHAVLIENDKIESVLPISSLPGKIEIVNHGVLLAPAFIDMQVYGAAGQLFAAYPSADSLFKLYAHCKAGGTDHFLPTIATNTYNVIKECIDAVKKYRDEGGKGLLGLHIEGPWINKVKRGAHVEALIHSPTPEEVRELLAYGKGVIRMITLAPEICSNAVMEMIRSENIIISAGHSNATYREGIDAFNSGIRSATHLFNAMSPFHHRDTGLPGAVMQHEHVMASIIPDGFHVDFAAISIAKKVMLERLYIITDAVTETTRGFYPHTYSGEKYVSNGILSGSALTMAKGVKNLVEKAGIDLAEALRMASLYPARLLGMDDALGKIETGFRANFVSLNNNLEVQSH